MDPPRLTLFSTPLVSTWVLDETHHVLFDAGDGTTALLEGKIHRASVVALTHAHRDHIAGLPQLLNLRAGVAFGSGTPLRVLGPCGSGSLMALARFLSAFDAGSAGRAQWVPFGDGDRLELDGGGTFLRAFRTVHLPDDPDPHRPRCLGYHLGRRFHRLRPELRGLPQAELDRIRAEQGRDALTAPEEEVILSVSGDTRILPPETYAQTRFLLHECTFLDEDAARCADARERGHEHSCLGDVLDMAQETHAEHLGLYHVSKRYTDEEILRSIRAECTRRAFPMKVSVALPGRVVTDLFAHPVWTPRL